MQFRRLPAKIHRLQRIKQNNPCNDWLLFASSSGGRGGGWFGAGEGVDESSQHISRMTTYHKSSPSQKQHAPANYYRREADATPKIHQQGRSCAMSQRYNLNVCVWCL